MIDPPPPPPPPPLPPPPRRWATLGGRLRAWLRAAPLNSWNDFRRGRWIIPFLLGMMTLAIGTVATLCSLSSTAPALPVDPDTGGPTTDIIVTLTPGLLTALVQQGIDSGRAPVNLQRIAVTPKGDSLVISGNAPIAFGRGVDGSLEVQPAVRDGHLQMDVLKVKLGPLPVPINVQRLIEDPVNERVAAALGGLPATVRSSRVTDSGLEVTARVRTEDLKNCRPGASCSSPTPVASPGNAVPARSATAGAGGARP